MRSQQSRTKGLHRWWFRRAGGREVLALALPLILSTLTYSLMNFMDRMLLAWYSTSALAAAVAPGILMWTLFSLPFGLASYATAFVAQYVGAGHPERVGRAVWQAVRLGLYCVPLFLAIALYSDQYFFWAGHEEQLVYLESLYFKAMSIGAGATVIGAALSAYFVGIGKTRVVMVVSILSSLINLLFDVLLIFGLAGFPEMGIEGAGLATSIAMWAQVVLYAGLIASSQRATIHQFASGRVMDWRLTGRLLRYGTPAGLQMFLEGVAITVFVIVMAGIDETAAAATAVVLSINMVAFVPIFGLGMAVTALVGQYLGGRRAALAQRASWTALVLGLAYTGFFALTYFLVPHWYLAGHAAAAGSEFAAVKSLSVILLMFVAFYCLFDTVQIVFVSVLKGAGDTWFVLVTTLITSAIFVVCGAAVSHWVVQPFHQILAWWSVLTLWVLMLAGAYFLRFLQGRWKSMSVIEPHLLPAPTEVALEV